MKKKLMLILNAIISIAIVAVILHVVGLEQVIEDIKGINLFFLLVSIFFLFLMDLALTYRIVILLKEVGIKLRYIDALKSHFVGMLAADFTPARTGYFATAAVLKYNYDVPSEKAMLSVFGPQIFDFAVKVVAGCIAIFYIATYFLKIENWWVLSLGAVVMLMLIAVMLLLLFSKRFLRLLSFLEKIPIVSKLYAMMWRMQAHSHVITKKTADILAIIAVAWTCKALSWYAAAKALGITVDAGFPEIVFYYFLQPLVTMLEFVPSATIAGLGLSEGASVLVFSLFGIPAAQAMAFALVVRFKTTLLHSISVPEALKVMNKPLL
ncbi:flippase-like domain-containing protein [Candidatus Micrarchaeota archaeon]|nr:flippase-like domain-containing protein [Candidatus Micrarchaeota archaeon]